MAVQVRDGTKFISGKCEVVASIPPNLEGLEVGGVFIAAEELGVELWGLEARRSSAHITMSIDQ